MIKMKNKAIFSFFLLSLALMTQAQEASDAVFQRLVHEYTLQADGSVDYHHFRELKINSYYDIHRAFGETFVIYDTQRERLSVRESYTLMADGKKVVTPQNAFNEILPREAAGAPPYSQMREMVITHTGLERGSTIILDYVRKTFNSPGAYFSGVKSMAEEAPVNAMTFILRFPANTPFNHKVLNSNAAPEISIADGMTTYRWEFTNLSAAVHEVYARPAASLYPTIIWSTASSFTAAWNHFTGQEAFRLRCDADMQLYADSMRSAWPNELERGLAIQTYVRQAIRDYGLSLEHTDYKVRNAEDTWKSSGGTLMEKAVLLAALCRAAGLDAYTALSIDAQLLDRSVPVKQAWEQPLVKITVSNSPVYLDPVKSNSYPAEYAMTDRFLLPVKPGEDLTEELGAATGAQAKLRYRLQLGDDMKLSGSVDMDLMNAANPSLALMKATDKASALSASKGYTVEVVPEEMKIGISRSSLTARFNAKDTLPAFGGIHKLELPVFALATDALDHAFLPQQRKTDIFLPYSIDLSVTWEVTLPENLRLVTSAEKEGMETLAGKMSHLITQKGNTWIIEQQLLLPATMEHALYREFRDVLTLWQSPNLRTFWVAPR